MFEIKIDDLQGPQIAQLLQQHLVEMRATSPPESKHALDLVALGQSNMQFWTVGDGSNLAGCGALLCLDGLHGVFCSCA